MAIARPTGMTPVREDEEDIRIRKIGPHDLRIALRQGWEDFMSKRGDLVFVGFIYPLVIALAGMYALDMSVLPLIFPLVAGAILLGPAAASGFYELARRREQGLDSRWRHFLDVVRGPAAPSLFAATGVIFVVFLLWMYAAWYIYAETLGPEAPASFGAFMRDVFTTPQGWTMILVGNLVGLCFAVLTLALSVVSFPMLVDRRVSWATAMRTSLRVTYENPITIAAWGLIVVGLLVLGTLPALVGLAVVLPVLGYATWHLYTRAVER